MEEEYERSTSANAWGDGQIEDRQGNMRDRERMEDGGGGGWREEGGGRREEGGIGGGGVGDGSKTAGRCCVYKFPPTLQNSSTHRTISTPSEKRW